MTYLQISENMVSPNQNIREWLGNSVVKTSCKNQNTSMSGLAPFVAATIRDKVVEDQQAEIAALKKQLSDAQKEKEKIATELLYQNPIRTISIRCQDRTIGSGEIDATDDYDLNSVVFSSGDIAEGGDVIVPLSVLLETCFLVDGQPVKRIRDLSCECHGFLLCHTAHTPYSRLVFTGVGLKVQADTYLSRDEYCCLFGIQQQEFEPDFAMGLDVFDSKIRPLSPMVLASLGMARMFKIVFDEGEFAITSDFVRNHLGLEPQLPPVSWPPTRVQL